MTDKSISYLRNTTGYNSGDWDNGNKGWDDPTVTDTPTGGLSDEQASKMDDALAKGLKWIGAIVLIIVFAPVLIGIGALAGIVYCLFRFARYRERFIIIISIIITVVMAGFFMLSGGLHQVTACYAGIWHAITHHANIIQAVLGALKTSFIPLFCAGGVLGSWVGLALIHMQVNRMRKSPHLVTEDLGTNWQYNWTYRMSPLEKYKEKKIVESIKNDTYKPYHKNDIIPLGIEDDILDKSPDPTANPAYQVVCRADNEVPKHTIVTGAAGSGKTVTLKSMMMRDIKRGKTIFVIDCKKDPEVAEFLSRETKKAGGHFYHYSADLPYRIQGNVEGPSSYDPIAGLNPAKRVDMILSTREWDTSASVYRDAANTYLSKVFATLDVAEDYNVMDGLRTIDTTQGEMWTFVQMLDKNIFNSVVVAMNKIQDTRVQYIRQQASSLNAALSPTASRTPEGQSTQRAQAEFQSKMSGLMVSPYGRWLKGGNGGGSGKIINVSELSSKPGNVVLFSIDAANQGDTGSVLGSIICTDLANMTETRKNKGENNAVSIYIDEFQSLPPDCVKSMLQKARSAGVGLTLALQSLEQITATVGNDSYVRGLLDTCSNFIFHAGSTYDTGVEVAKIIGQRDVTRYVVGRRNETKIGAFNFTNNRDLQVSQHQEKDWVIDPSSPQSLTMPSPQNNYRSEAIIVKKASDDPIDAGNRGASAHKVHMIAPDDAVHEWFDVNSPEIDIDAPLEIRIKSKGLAQDIKAAHEAVASGVTDGTQIINEASHAELPHLMGDGTQEDELTTQYENYRKRAGLGDSVQPARHEEDPRRANREHGEQLPLPQVLPSRETNRARPRNDTMTRMPMPSRNGVNPRARQAGSIPNGNQVRQAMPTRNNQGTDNRRARANTDTGMPVRHSKGNVRNGNDTPRIPSPVLPDAQAQQHIPHRRRKGGGGLTLDDV